jgi:hypothetical protein
MQYNKPCAEGGVEFPPKRHIEWCESIHDAITLMRGGAFGHNCPIEIGVSMTISAPRQTLFSLPTSDSDPSPQIYFLALAPKRSFSVVLFAWNSDVGRRRFLFSSPAHFHQIIKAVFTGKVPYELLSCPLDQDSGVCVC